MPFKHNAARRHRIPRARYRVTNWPAYEAGLRRRGDLTLWLDEAAVAGWSAPKRSTPGGQPIYSDLAIELVLSLRLVFHLALRQAEAFAGSVLRLLGLDLSVPDHSTLSRRGRAFAGRCPRVLPSPGPIHLVLDSTGLELFGQGEWNAAKHGRARRNWRKLHLAIDAGTGKIAAHVLTQRQRRRRSTSAASAPRRRGVPSPRSRRTAPMTAIPPRASAVLSTDNPDAQSPRDRHLRLMAERGRIGWQRATGYGRRNHADTAMGRYKHLIGPRLRARSLSGQQGEVVAIGVSVLNRMIQTGKPVSVRA
jgi:hypothetical protein